MKIYTNADWEEAVHKADAAAAAVAAIVEKQKEQRCRIVEEKEALDAELDGPVNRRASAYSFVNNLRWWLLGPWIIDRSERWEGAVIYHRDGPQDCWNRRGWLRVMLRDGPMWQFDYNHDSVALGAPTDEPGDFEMRLEEATNLLVKAGFIFP